VLAQGVEERHAWVELEILFSAVHKKSNWDSGRFGRL
jgi:hypothetical protein